MRNIIIILTILIFIALGTVISVIAYQKFKEPINNFLTQSQNNPLYNSVKNFQNQNIIEKTQQLNNQISDNLDNYDQQITNSINEFFKTNNPKICEYSYENNQSKVQGILYLYNQKILNTNLYTENGVNKKNNYLLDGNYLYTWGSDIPSLKVDISSLLNTSQDKQITEGFDFKQLGIDKGLNLVCNNWEADENVFKIPPNINFIDLKQNLQKVTDQINITSEKIFNAKNKVCEACNISPTESLINECKKALNCK